MNSLILCLAVVLFVSDSFSADFSAIDQHTLSVPPVAEQNPATLSAYLVKPAVTDVEKARAIYRWITENVAYDTDGLFSGNYGDLSPAGVLRRRAAVCEGYAGLFTDMATRSGLEAVTVPGYSKGYGYKVGQKITGGPNHAWNAAKLDGKWYLLDCTWGAGYMDENNRYIRKFQPFYFCTGPDTFLYDHLPEEDKWQLLPAPVSLETFEAMPYLRPLFFTSGLQLISHWEPGITCDRAKLTVTFKVPEGVYLAADVIRGREVLPTGNSFYQKQDSTGYIYVLFPATGTYTLRVYAKKGGSQGTYTWITDYRVINNKGTYSGGFPKKYAPFTAKGAFLFSPHKGNLKSAGKILFKIRVPGADKVAVVNNSRWTFFTRKNDIFSGSVKLAAGKAELYAQFPGADDYSALLEYQVE